MNRLATVSTGAAFWVITSPHDSVAKVKRRIREWFRNRRSQPQLNRELELLQEERRKERERIGRDLHDTLLQGLIGASLLVHRAVEQAPLDFPTARSICQALGLMDRAIEEGRVALQGLCSSGTTSTSLEQALSRVGEEFTAGSGIRFRVFVGGKHRTLTPAMQEQIYLIGREAVANAMRHSRATDIEVEVEYQPDRLRLRVRDNGLGMDPKLIQSKWGSHLGLPGMIKRAETVSGRLDIWSSPRAGTEVEISVPF
jgi:signal transduction histidine kinase